ncbi:MAG TPA: hypothetical protein VHX38_08820 [Pseudonocardiaceae bacterium]|jgi:hypothetical protein|nr:hypothetical protein [Pseudonocardiaceae bacterium]
MHELLTQVTADLAQRSVDAWRPAFGSSPGRQEATVIAGLTRSDGVTPWGTAPMEVVWKAGELLYIAVLEHARAVAQLLVPPFRTWAPSAEVRAAVEAAGQVAWLFDPAVPSSRIRIGRYYTLRLKMAQQLDYTYSKVQPGGPLSDYGMPPADVEAEAGLLGLTAVPNRNGAVIGYEGQKPQKIEDLVPLIVGHNGAYSLLSGSAHSEFWSLLGGYRGQQPSPLGITPQQHEAEPESFVPLVRACIQALFKPIDYACQMFDRGVLAADLNRIYKTVLAVMGP